MRSFGLPYGQKEYHGVLTLTVFWRRYADRRSLCYRDSDSIAGDRRNSTRKIERSGHGRKHTALGRTLHSFCLCAFDDNTDCRHWHCGRGYRLLYRSVRYRLLCVGFGQEYLVYAHAQCSFPEEGNERKDVEEIAGGTLWGHAG